MVELAPCRSSIYRFFITTALFAGTTFSASVAQQPAPTISAGCGVLKGVTTCNWAAFKQVLASAHVVAIEPSQIDHPTTRQLTEFATWLGKTIASSGQPADLTFVILPTSTPGVTFGLADQPILKLQILDGSSSGGRLLWVETLSGPSDRPWPSNVHAVIEQFEDRLKHR